MLITSTEYIDGKPFIVHKSDANFLIQNENGVLYDEAWDLPHVKHEYTETDIEKANDEDEPPIEDVELFETDDFTDEEYEDLNFEG